MSISFHAKVKEGWTIHSNLESFVFPGGEPHIRDTQPDSASDVVAQIAIVLHPTMEDLFTLALWRDIVHYRGEEAWVAMPYLPFARADRGAPLSAHVFADFINSFVQPNRIVALDPHSPVVADRLGIHTVLTVLNLPAVVKYAIGPVKYDGIISPDKGAVDRAQSVADELGRPLFRAEKTRDFDTGKLSGFHMVDKLPYKGRFLIVDDICDGGGTFVGLADVIRKSSNATLDLWVSHGIFSKGKLELQKRFDDIYTTNSWHVDSLEPNSFIHVTDLTPYLFGALSNVKE